MSNKDESTLTSNFLFEVLVVRAACLNSFRNGYREPGFLVDHRGTYLREFDLF